MGEGAINVEDILMIHDKKKNGLEQVISYGKLTVD